MPAIKQLSTDEIIQVAETPVWRNGLWDCGDQRFLDPGKDLYEVVEDTSAPQLTRVQFKMLFTSAERIAIKEARATDAILDDFYELLEDPQLTYIDLDLQSNRDAINYLASKGYITPERIPEILSGQLQ